MGFCTCRADRQPEGRAVEHWPVNPAASCHKAPQTECKGKGDGVYQAGQLSRRAHLPDAGALRRAVALRLLLALQHPLHDVKPYAVGIAGAQRHRLRLHLHHLQRGWMG